MLLLDEPVAGLDPVVTKELYEIIEKCDCKKVVVNAITLETLSLAQESFEKLGYEYSVAQICASRGRKVGGYNMMTAQNPVFIICGEKL